MMAYQYHGPPAPVYCRNKAAMIFVKPMQAYCPLCGFAVCDYGHKPSHWRAASSEAQEPRQ